MEPTPIAATLRKPIDPLVEGFAIVSRPLLRQHCKKAAGKTTPSPPILSASSVLGDTPPGDNAEDNSGARSWKNWRSGVVADHQPTLAHQVHRIP
jgi:hypothetical protein